MSVLNMREAQAITDVCVSLGLALRDSLIAGNGMQADVQGSWSDVGGNICELIEAANEDD